MFPWFKWRRRRTADFKKEEKIKWIKHILKKYEVSASEQKMIASIIEMGYLTARDVMIPRIDVFTLNIHLWKKEMEKLALNKASYSRIPVYEGSIDNVKGILHIKDILGSLVQKQRKFDISKILSDPYFVPESKKIIEILREFQHQHIHLAIVVDEYGGFSGILTMEDIIEEIIGDVQDEFDSKAEEIKKLDEGIYSVDARIDFQTFKDYFQIDLSTEEADTLGGYLIMLQGYIPKLNQIIKTDKALFKVINKRRNSLMRIRMEIKKPHGKLSSAEVKSEV